jgi:hypothetical protein
MTRGPRFSDRTVRLVLPPQRSRLYCPARRLSTEDFRGHGSANHRAKYQAHGSGPEYCAARSAANMDPRLTLIEMLATLDD